MRCEEWGVTTTAKDIVGTPHSSLLTFMSPFISLEYLFLAYYTFLTKKHITEAHPEFQFQIEKLTENND